MESEENKENLNPKNIQHNFEELTAMLSDLDIEFEGYTGKAMSFQELSDDWMFNFGMDYVACKETLLFSERFISENRDYLDLLDVYDGDDVEQLFYKFYRGDSLDFDHALNKILRDYPHKYDFLISTIVDCSCPHIITSTIEKIIKEAQFVNIGLMEHLLSRLTGPIPPATFMKWLTMDNEDSPQTLLLYLYYCVDKTTVNDEMLSIVIQNFAYLELIEKIAGKLPYISREIYLLALEYGYDFTKIHIKKNAFRVIN